MRVVNDLQLFLNLFFVIRALFEVVDRPPRGVVTVQLRQFLLNDPALLVSLVLVGITAPHYHEFLHH